MKPRTSRSACAIAVVLLVAGCQETEMPTAVEDAPIARESHVGEIGILQATVWLDQFGTAEADAATDVWASPEGVFVVGSTGGDLLGPEVGYGDVFLARYDANGAPVWTRQFGSNAQDTGLDLAATADAVYVVGWSLGALVGLGGDLYVRRYDLDGNVVWTDEFGAPDPGSASGVAADASGVYVAGWIAGPLGGGAYGGAGDAFLRRYDAAGTLLWTRQFGNAASEIGTSTAVANGGVYVAGVTDGPLHAPGAGENDVFVRRYDTSGTLQWGRQFGTTAEDRVFAIAADASGVYLAGGTFGSLGGASAGGEDILVSHYAATGDHVWTRQFGTAADDIALGITVDGSGVYLAGHTEGDIAGSVGGRDAIVRKYDHAGTEVWTRQLGTTTDEEINGVSVSGSALFAAGATLGDLEGTNAGARDAFVARLAHTSPEGQLADIDADVADLLAAGDIGAGEARSLRAKLDAAQAQLDAGNTTAAIRLLTAFIHEVEAMIASGRLTEAEGRPLIDAANALIVELEG